MTAKRQAFGEFLIVSLNQAYTSKLSQSEETPTASRNHYRRMSRILSLPLTKKGTPISLRRRAAIAILVAAAILLLGGCGAILREYFLPDDFTQSAVRSYNQGECIFIRDPNYQERLNTLFLPTIPADFIATDKSISDTTQSWEWDDKQGNKIRFLQFALMYEFRSIGVKDYETYQNFTDGTVTYFYQENPDTRLIVWTYQGYGFSLQLITRGENNNPITADDLLAIAKSTIENQS